MSTNDTTVPEIATEIVELAEDRSSGETAPLAKPDWRLGLPLLPEHFEAQDRYHEDLVRYAVRAILDPPWGIAELSLDDSALSAGLLGVTRFRGILGDGTLVVAGLEGAAPIPARNLARQLRGRSRLDIYIGLPIVRAADGAEPRYIEETALVPDYGTGRGPIELPWARPNLRLLTEDERLGGYATVPIARIHYVEGRAELDPSFVPPVLRLRASSWLKDCVQRIGARVEATKRTVCEGRRPTAEMTGTDAGRLLVAAVLARFLPRLRHLVTTDAHPREAYLALAELAGTLSAFAARGEVPIPPFDFVEIGATFGTLEESIRTTLDALGGPAIREVALHRQDEHCWVGLLNEPGIFGREFFLVLSGGDSAGLAERVPPVVKVTAREKSDELRRAAVGGVPLIPEGRRPHGIEVPSHAACFRIDRKHEHWQVVVKYGSFALLLPQGFTSLQPRLFTQEPHAFGS